MINIEQNYFYTEFLMKIYMFLYENFVKEKQSVYKILKFLRGKKCLERK